jgi:hypothetical protein
MKTGNKNQAVILSIVAVGAIGFLAIQLTPAKLGPASANPGQSSTSAAAIGIPTDLPLALAGDPFSHSRLATKRVTTDPGMRPRSEFGLDAPPLKPLGPYGENYDTQSNQGTEENAGIDRQKPQGPQISVLAVMRAGTPVAMLQVGGKEANTYMQGELLSNGVWLVAIGGNYVKVRVNGEVHRIDIGDTYGAGDGDKE